VDEEVKKLLAECYDRAKQIIREHLDAMDKIAQFLIEKETITGKEFMKIYREVENIPEPTEEEIEAAKHGRIYATRAESALVGENVPIKTKEDKAKTEEPESEAPKVGFDATVSDSNVSGGYTPREYKPQEAYQPQESLWNQEQPAQEKEPESGEQTEENQPVGGGRFSHVPDDFDKKN
jgi:cell division protease FtsH